MAKRSIKNEEAAAGKPQRRRSTTAIPGPVDASLEVPIAEAADMAMPVGASERSSVERYSSEDVARLAYELFEDRGREHGHDLEHWLTAEQELRNRTGRR